MLSRENTQPASQGELPPEVAAYWFRPLPQQSEHNACYRTYTLKALLIGTFHGVSIRYLGDYLREVVYRFNRRSLGHELFGYVVWRAMTRPWVRADKLQPESAG